MTVTEHMQDAPIALGSGCITCPYTGRFALLEAPILRVHLQDGLPLLVCHLHIKRQTRHSGIITVDDMERPMVRPWGRHGRKDDGTSERALAGLQGARHARQGTQVEFLPIDGNNAHLDLQEASSRGDIGRQGASGSHRELLARNGRQRVQGDIRDLQQVRRWVRAARAPWASSCTTLDLHNS